MNYELGMQGLTRVLGRGSLELAPTLAISGQSNDKWRHFWRRCIVTLICALEIPLLTYLLTYPAIKCNITKTDLDTPERYTVSCRWRHRHSAYRRVVAADRCDDVAVHLCHMTYYTPTTCSTMSTRHPLTAQSTFATDELQSLTCHTAMRLFLHSTATTAVSNKPHFHFISIVKLRLSTFILMNNRIWW